MLCLEAPPCSRRSRTCVYVGARAHVCVYVVLCVCLPVVSLCLCVVVYKGMLECACV